jgi:Rps23 Pro-64 3,4-dihydroxylase Tpa1-like proline 4-hydroxylase
VPGFLSAGSLERINATFPPISQGGSYPVDALDDGMAIKDVIEELDSPRFEAVVAEKMGVDLAGRPKMFSLRGFTRAKDGKIHTDSKDKLITVLLYLNEHWSPETGRLRLLRQGHDLEDFAVEVPPQDGNLLIFRRSDNSWHGHHPFEGQRRALQMNWMVDETKRGFHQFRHRVSAALKLLTTK